MEYLQGWSGFSGDHTDDEDNILGGEGNEEELSQTPLSNLETLYPSQYKRSVSTLNSNVSLETTKLLGTEDEGEESDTEWQGWVWDLQRRKWK